MRARVRESTAAARARARCLPAFAHFAPLRRSSSGSGHACRQPPHFADVLFSGQCCGARRRRRTVAAGARVASRQRDRRRAPLVRPPARAEAGRTRGARTHDVRVGGDVRSKAVFRLEPVDEGAEPGQRVEQLGLVDEMRLEQVVQQEVRRGDPLACEPALVAERPLEALEHGRHAPRVLAVRLGRVRAVAPAREEVAQVHGRAEQHVDPRPRGRGAGRVSVLCGHEGEDGQRLRERHALLGVDVVWQVREVQLERLLDVRPRAPVLRVARGHLVERLVQLGARVRGEQPHGRAEPSDLPVAQHRRHRLALSVPPPGARAHRPARPLCPPTRPPPRLPLPPTHPLATNGTTVAALPIPVRAWVRARRTVAGSFLL